MPPTAAESSPNQTPLWQPSGERIARANITRFIECINARRGLSLRDYASLYEWSIREPAAFWSELARFTDTRARWGDAPVIQDSARPPRTRWFADTEINFAQNLLRYRDGEPALVFVDERGTRRELCYRELYAQVARIAHGLRDLGVTRGDRVAAYMPNLPETIIAMLATTSLGAIWCSCALEHGAQHAIERFGPLAPKVLFTADGYAFAGERHERLGQVAAALAHLPSVEHVIVTGYLDARPEISALRGARDFAAFGIACAEIEFVATPFDHPVYIVFASAAGGPPQGIVHGAGGTLLQHQK
ncbi:MAG TPA: AMP-binding protein, partial [Steroidobacteraceae bacterium]